MSGPRGDARPAPEVAPEAQPEPGRPDRAAPPAAARRRARIARASVLAAVAVLGSALAVSRLADGPGASRVTTGAPAGTVTRPERSPGASTSLAGGPAPTGPATSLLAAPTSPSRPAPTSTSRPAPATPAGTPRRCAAPGEDAGRIERVAVAPDGSLWAELRSSWFQASFAVSADGGSSWSYRCRTIGGDRVFSVFALEALDAGNAWALTTGPGDDHVARTGDGGATWSFTSPVGGFVGRGMDIVGPATGWVWGGTWSTEPSPDAPCQVPNDRCSPYAWQPRLFRMTDGLSWAPVVLPAGSVDVFDAGFADADHGWIAQSGVGAPLFATADGGRSWAPVALPEGANAVLEVAVADADHVHVVATTATGRLLVASTGDAGATWSVFRVEGGAAPGQLEVAAFGPAVAVAALGSDGGSWQTTDGG
ncbi:MAG TPA: YCF48-related protein, partial [Acidimicrobiales bacterium]|nr:YCF48-related protein [Acidimicrobiales bacterium]